MLAYDTYKLVIDKLLLMVDNETLKPNEKIYSENQLARILNIPRTQVREVYSALNILGILYGEQGKGTFFASNENNKSTEILYLMTLLNGSDFEDIVEMRRVLEIGSIKLAIKNRNKEEIEKLKKYALITLESEDYLELAEADEMFHYTIAEMTGNPLIKYTHEIIRGYVSRVATSHWKHMITEKQFETKQLFAQQHMDIINYIEKGYTNKASNQMEEHFKLLIDNMPNKK